MRRKFQDYGELAQQEFLRGTRFKTPVEAVERGMRSIEEWCDCLAMYRQSQRREVVKDPAEMRYTSSD